MTVRPYSSILPYQGQVCLHHLPTQVHGLFLHNLYHKPSRLLQTSIWIFLLNTVSIQAVLLLFFLFPFQVTVLSYFLIP